MLLYKHKKRESFKLSPRFGLYVSPHFLYRRWNDNHTLLCPIFITYYTISFFKKSIQDTNKHS